MQEPAKGFMNRLILTMALGAGPALTFGVPAILLKWLPQLSQFSKAGCHGLRPADAIPTLRSLAVGSVLYGTTDSRG